MNFTGNMAGDIAGVLFFIMLIALPTVAAIVIFVTLLIKATKDIARGGS